MNIPEDLVVGNKKHLNIVIRQCVHRGWVTFDDAVQIHKHLPQLALPLKVHKAGGKIGVKRLSRLILIFSKRNP